VEETIKMLKANEGFHSYLIVKNDGIVIKYEKMSYDEAKQWAYNVLDLTMSTAKYVKQLLAPDEVTISVANFTLCARFLVSHDAQFSLRFKTFGCDASTTRPSIIRRSSSHRHSTTHSSAHNTRENFMTKRVRRVKVAKAHSCAC
jgi:hypothetical protein